MRPHNSASDAALNLYVGDIVEVRSKKEILATLDRDGTIDALPFMPEMLQYCGKRFRVYKRADKACDTIGKTGSRRMENAVHLEGIRCNGAEHGGCQASCLIFWKEAWLKRVTNPSKPAAIVAEPESLVARNATPQQGATNVCTEDILVRATRKETDETDIHAEIFACQITELSKATSYLAWWDIRHYIRDLRSGNIGLLQLLRGVSIATFNMTIRNAWRGAFAIKSLGMLHAAVDTESPQVSTATIVAFHGLETNKNKFREKLKAKFKACLVEYPHIQGKLKNTPCIELNLQPGELVQVKSKEEILDTLDINNKNRGLLFDVEMLPYCGKTFRVLRRVEKIINEKNGKMIRMPNNCLILEGVTCGGCLSRNRLFCPRSIYPYWHEIWLKRVE